MMNYMLFDQPCMLVILCGCSHAEIARINELRAMADMLQKQLEGNMHAPSSGSALGPRPSLGGGRGGSRESDSGGSVVLVSNLSEKVFLIYCISCVIYSGIYWNSVCINF